MLDFHWGNLLLFAQGDNAAEVQPEQAAEPGKPAPQPGLQDFILPFALTMVVFYLLIVLPERRRNRDKSSLLDSLKKNDKVVTVGGIHAVVVNVKPGEDEIVLKIDEDKDVKIKVTKASIAKVLTKSDKEGTT